MDSVRTYEATQEKAESHVKTQSMQMYTHKLNRTFTDDGGGGIGGGGDENISAGAALTARFDKRLVSDGARAS